MWRILNRLAAPFGLTIAPRRDLEMVYQHKYRGGYAEYRAAQIAANRRKLSKVWADEATLGVVAEDIETHLETVGRGLCHGARNGFEVSVLRQRLSADVIGTDISDTALEFDHMVV